jgi:hypothetical protein
VVRPVSGVVLVLVFLLGLVWKQPHAGVPRLAGVAADSPLRANSIRLLQAKHGH